MNGTDVRDEKLGDLLDRAVRDLEPRWDGAPGAVASRGNRTMRLLAAVITAAFFVGVVAWAATQVGSQDNAPVTYGSLETDGWALAAPATWTSTSILPCEVNDVLGTGVIVSSVDFEFRDPLRGEPSCGDRFVFAGFPTDGVALSYEPAGTIPGPVPGPRANTVLPLSRPSLMVTDQIRGGPAMSYTAVVVDGGTIAYVRLWIGSAAPVSFIEEAERVLGSIDVAGAVHGQTYRDADHGLSVTYPDGWIVADGNLTPWLSSPVEILSLGNFPLRVSPDPIVGLRLFDAPVAPAALADMTARDAFVSLQESGFTGDIEVRPDTFRPQGCGNAILGCETGDYPIEVPFQAWWMPFEDEGRAFYLFVAIGNDAPPQLADDAWAIADSLLFYPD